MNPRYILTSIIILCLLSILSFGQKEPKIVLKEVSEKCEGIKFEDRVIVQVARFNVLTNNATGQFGGELASMLNNALQSTSCFRVLGLDRDFSDNTQNAVRGQAGFTTGSTQLGQALSPQLILTGEVTTYSEGANSTSFAGVKVGSNKATVGFIFQVKDPASGLVLFSESIQMDGKSSGFTGVSLMGVNVAGTVQNKAVSAACELAIIKAVEILVNKKDEIPIPEIKKIEEMKPFDPATCTVLKTTPPTVMVFIPEALTYGNSAIAVGGTIDKTTQQERAYNERMADRQLVRDIFTGGRSSGNTNPANNVNTSNKSNAIYKNVVVEESTTENEIIKAFINAGFKVIDPKVYKTLMGEKSYNDPAELAALGKEMGANIVLTGIATTERLGVMNNMNSFRGRIELRAIETSEGTILASHDEERSGVDVSETGASKLALTNAAKVMSNYMLNQICAKEVKYDKLASAGATTKVLIENISFSDLSSIYNKLKANKKIVGIKRTLKDGVGELTLMHDLDVDAVAEMISKPEFHLEITNLDEKSIHANYK